MKSVARALLSMALVAIVSPCWAEYVVLWEFADSGPGVNLCGRFGANPECPPPTPYADFDGDGTIEFVALRNNPPYVVNILDGLTGSIEASIKVQNPYYVWVRPIDIDMDHVPEIMVYDEQGRAGVIAFTGQTAAVPADGGVRDLAPTAIHPNPFNPSATVDYSVLAKGKANIQIYDVAGRSVRTLLNGVTEPGKHSVVWDGRSDEGNQLPSGSYFYTLSLDGKVLDKGKAVILK